MPLSQHRFREDPLADQPSRHQHRAHEGGNEHPDTHGPGVLGQGDAQENADYGGQGDERAESPVLEVGPYPMGPQGIDNVRDQSGQPLDGGDAPQDVRGPSGSVRR